MVEELHEDFEPGEVEGLDDEEPPPAFDDLEEDGDDIPAVVGDTGGDDQIDDPIRIYLMQMGEIPLLDRGQEIAAAQADRAQPQAVSAT